ncbi:multidrug ABC transporter ATP-binding protein [Nostoc calcicola FACHB-389]|nr:ABC transporter ATP-binding protein [Nostoc calcicola FACHB-3891]OKH24059.1 multidrug ABC transporter ATP-binding protein [Nostoc calcicola FACHB-389]
MLLTAYDLWKFYKEKPVVQGVSFTINSGQILGLLGSNGAGKTTIIGMLYGAVIPNRGFVQLGNYQVQSQPREAKKMMGIVSQENNIDPDFTVMENLVFFAHHYRITGKKARQRARELLALVEMQDYAKYRINNLSAGLKRRLVLARALINHPRFIFLDEPTTGLDPDVRQNFWQLVIDLKKNGCGILLTTHYMDEAERLCDDLILLQQGKIIKTGSPQQIIQSEIGKEIVEIEGISQATLQQLAKQYQTWYHPFGKSYLLSLPAENSQVLWQQLSATNPLRLTRRPGNLEDVFLRITGKSLERKEER